MVAYATTTEWLSDLQILVSEFCMFSNNMYLFTNIYIYISCLVQAPLNVGLNGIVLDD